MPRFGLRSVRAQGQVLLVRVLQANPVHPSGGLLVHARGPQRHPSVGLPAHLCAKLTPIIGRARKGDVSANVG